MLDATATVLVLPQRVSVCKQNHNNQAVGAVDSMQPFPLLLSIG
jgi:hypothetical protein